MMTDPIADMLTRIRNAVAVGKETVEIPATAVKESIARVLREEGYIQDYRTAGEKPHRFIKIYLKYGPLGQKVFRELKRVSVPGRRVYCPVKDLPHIYNGLGITIVSTNKGILSDAQCRRLNVGGEILCTVF